MEKTFIEGNDAGKLITTKEQKDQVYIWLEALRSGKYTQTNGALQNSHGFCCLGLACKVIIPADEQKIEDGYLRGLYPGYQTSAPKWLNNIDEYAENSPLGKKRKLSVLNDSDGFSFTQIADVIEEVLKPEMDLIVD